jgi:hypothetical protein
LQGKGRLPRPATVHLASGHSRPRRSCSLLATFRIWRYRRLARALLPLASDSSSCLAAQSRSRETIVRCRLQIRTNASTVFHRRGAMTCLLRVHPGWRPTYRNSPVAGIALYGSDSSLAARRSVPCRCLRTPFELVAARTRSTRPGPQSVKWRRTAGGAQHRRMPRGPVGFE